MTDDIARARFGFVDNNDGIGITDVDCTPRDLRREGYLSEAQYNRAIELKAKQNALTAKSTNELRTGIGKRNRAAALQLSVLGADGIEQFFTQCACGWCGLRVTDPELARREYDAHACAIGTEFVPGKTLHAPVEANALPIDWAQTTKDLLDRKFGGEATPVVTTTDESGAERRFQLMELK
jgi:hypothetical protein